MKRIFTRFAKWFRHKARGQKLQRAMERNKEAVADLDAAVREVLHK
ncbi:hypothetical protein [Aliiroseovarius subalbicans]|nr:hypothetical protein [Aliiroseovarius subalbicans]MCI2398790.1 hypothetical protein [Aliiroseovarius subalbicans]